MTPRQQWKALRAPLIHKLLHLRASMRADLDLFQSTQPSHAMIVSGRVHTTSDRLRLDAFNRWQAAMFEYPQLRKALDEVRAAERSGEDALLWKLANG